MPFPNWWSARIRDPKNYVRFWTKKNHPAPNINTVFGVREDGVSEVQAFRLKRSVFSLYAVKAWLQMAGKKYLYIEGSEQ